MKEKNKKYILKERVRNTVEIWIVEVDEDGNVIKHIAEFMDYNSANEYLDLKNKESND